jgi:hypothetical protein
MDNDTHKLLPFVSLLYHHKASGSQCQQAQSASSIKGYYTDIIAKICINKTGGLVGNTKKCSERKTYQFNRAS